MVRRSMTPTNWFWNQLGFAIATLSVGVSISVSQSRTFELELAEYKIKTNSALARVKEVSDTLEKSAELLPIAEPKRQEIEKDLAESSAVLEEVEEEIDQEYKDLIHPEFEE